MKVFLNFDSKKKSEDQEIRFTDSENSTLHTEKFNPAKRNYEGVGNFEPIPFSSIDRIEAPLLLSFHIDRMKRLLKKNGCSNEKLASYEQVIERLVPPLADFPDIVHLSGAVLDGQPGAKRRMRELLTSIQPKFFTSRRPSQWIPEFGNDFSPRICLLSSDVFNQLQLATGQLSSTPKELDFFQNQLELGLTGIRTLERLINRSMPHGGAVSHQEIGLAFERGLNGIMNEFPKITPWPPLPEPSGSGVPPIEDFLPELDLCDAFREQCTHESRTGVSITTSDASNEGSYRIDSISPSPAAIGEVITITGVNFGPFVTSVLFPRCGGEVIAAEPISQTETEVTVQVPPGVGDGDLSLKIVLDLVRVCNHISVIYEFGEPGYFKSASPVISYFRETDGDRCYISGEVITLEWHTCPSDAMVSLRLPGGDWQEVNLIGSRSFVIPGVTGEVNLYAFLKVSTFSNDITQRLRLYVAGEVPSVSIEAVEFTQGIQTMFRDDGTPDNSLPLVRNKATAVRVYVDVDREGFNNDYLDITGELYILQTETTLRPTNQSGPFISKGTFSEDDRLGNNGTLNFLIPENLCDRQLNLEINIVGDWYCEPKPMDSWQGSIEFREIPSLPLRIRRVRGQAGNAPSISDCRSLILRAFDYLPSPKDNVSFIDGTHQVNFLVKAAGGYNSDVGMWLLASDLAIEHQAIEALLFPKNIWIGLTHNYTRGIMAWPDKSTCLAHGIISERKFR